MTRLEKFSRVAEIAEKRAEAATVKLAERVRGVTSGEAQLTERNRCSSPSCTGSAMNTRAFPTAATPRCRSPS